MAPRRRSGLEVFDELADSAIGAMFDRGAEFIERMKQGAAKPLPDIQYTCIVCKLPKDCELVHPAREPSEMGFGFGICKPCLDFAWQATKEKLAYLARTAARTAAGRAAPLPPRRPPWEVLEVAPDASEEEIKKAYRKIAAQWHPDRFQDVAEKDQARLKFEEITRARDAMLKVRQVSS